MGAILGAIGPRDLSGGRVQKRARRFFVPKVNKKEALVGVSFYLTIDKWRKSFWRSPGHS